MSDNIIKGSWFMQNGRICKDEQTKKIDQMIEDTLTEVDVKNGGWTKLLIDLDGKYWELSHPDSESHGGGAPQLERLNIGSADQWKK